MPVKVQECLDAIEDNRLYFDSDVDSEMKLLYRNLGRIPINALPYVQKL